MAKHNWDFITDSSDVNDDCEKLMHKLMESVDKLNVPRYLITHIKLLG